MQHFDVLAYAYDADVHCLDCTGERFGNPEHAVDSEGNEPTPLFAGQSDRELHCGTCREHIEGTEDEPLERIRYSRLDDFTQAYVLMGIRCASFFNAATDDSPTLDGLFYWGELSAEDQHEIVNECKSMQARFPTFIAQTPQAFGASYWMVRNQRDSESPQCWSSMMVFSARSQRPRFFTYDDSGKDTHTQIYYGLSVR